MQRVLIEDDLNMKCVYLTTVRNIDFSANFKFRGITENTSFVLIQLNLILKKI